MLMGPFPFLKSSSPVDLSNPTIRTGFIYRSWLGHNFIPEAKHIADIWDSEVNHELDEIVSIDIDVDVDRYASQWPNTDDSFTDSMDSEGDNLDKGEGTSQARALRLSSSDDSFGSFVDPEGADDPDQLVDAKEGDDKVIESAGAFNSARFPSSEI